MSPIRRSRHHRGDDDGAGPQVEDQAVRQYRFILRTAPADALTAVHREALGSLSRDDRATVLRCVQQAFVAGQRLTPDDVADLARLLTSGERRAAGGFLRTCPGDTLHALAVGAIGSEAAFGLFGGYAAWDGADPEPADVGVDHGGDPVGTTMGDPGAEAKAFAHGHALIVQPWGGGGGG